MTAKVPLKEEDHDAKVGLGEDRSNLRQGEFQRVQDAAPRGGQVLSRDGEPLSMKVEVPGIDQLVLPDPRISDAAKSSVVVRFRREHLQLLVSWSRD
jgi:hypothetical protein